MLWRWRCIKLRALLYLFQGLLLSIPQPVAASQRILGASLAVAVAVLSWTGDASVAWAGCGDHLMPLHTDGSPGDASARQSPRETIADSLVTRFPPRPCDGPGCGETPPDQPGLAALPQPHRTGSGVVALAGMALPYILPMIIDRCVAESEGTPHFLSADVFRPPSDCR